MPRGISKYRDKVIEIDLIAETSQGPKPIEIKSSATFKEDLLRKLIQAHSRLAGLKNERSLVYAGDKSFKFRLQSGWKWKTRESLTP